MQVAYISLLLTSALPIHFFEQSQVIVCSPRNKVFVYNFSCIPAVFFISDDGDALVSSLSRRCLLLGRVRAELQAFILRRREVELRRQFDAYLWFLSPEATLSCSLLWSYHASILQVFFSCSALYLWLLTMTGLIAVMELFKAFPFWLTWLLLSHATPENWKIYKHTASIQIRINNCSIMRISRLSTAGIK